MNRNIALRAIATIGFLVMILINALANILPINGLSTGEVAALYPSLFTPAGFTFSIWSVIYLLLSGFIIFAWTHREEKVISAILPLFILSCFLNAAWILAWHYLMPLLSVFIMLALLYTLTKIFIATQKSEISTSPLFIKIPFSIYLAWICIATVANISAYLTSFTGNISLLSQEISTIVMLIVAASLILFIFIKFRVPMMVVVLLWTLAGIFFRWRGTEFGYLTYSTVIIGTAVLAIMIFQLRRTGSN